jgi:hypothetical protein
MKALHAAALALFALTPAAAPAQQPAAAAEDDIVNRIISIPNPTAYRVDGPRGAGRVRNDQGVQGGKAMRVTVNAPNAEAWRVSLAVPIQRAVAAGDNLVLAFWARLERGPDGAATSTLPNNTVQLAAAPYSAVFAGPVTVTPEWQMFEIRGRANRAYAAGELNVAMHLANARHVVDIGPVFVLNMGQ